MSREKPNALVLTRYESKGASSRIRLLQFVPIFETLMNVRVQSLFSNSYVDGIGTRSKVAQFIAGFPGIVKRVFFLCGLIVGRRKFHVVILQQELLPFVPSMIELWALRRILSGTLIIDIDDGNQIRYQQGRFLTRSLCGRKFQDLWSSSDLVVCGSHLLIDDVTPFLRTNAKAVLIPSVPPESTAAIDRQPTPPPPFVIGWIGSPSTATDLDLVRRPLSVIASDFAIELHVVGAYFDPSPNFKVLCFPWSLNSEQDLLRTMHIGIMPLTNTEFRQRKCSYKLIQYMSVGVPVIASNVGGNAEVIGDGAESAGLVVSTEEDWMTALRRMIEDQKYRLNAGEMARAIQQKRYSYQRASQAWIHELQSALGPA